MPTTNQGLDRVRTALEDAGIIVHGVDRLEKNRLGGVEIDVAVTVPADGGDHA